MCSSDSFTGLSDDQRFWEGMLIAQNTYTNFLSDFNLSQFQHALLYFLIFTKKKKKDFERNITQEAPGQLGQGRVYRTKPINIFTSRAAAWSTNGSSLSCRTVGRKKEKKLVMGFLVFKSLQPLSFDKFWYCLNILIRKIKIFMKNIILIKNIL